MIAAPPDDRPDMKVDLTRWNRAALSRFGYVDGDAATWLEELRIAMLGLYMDGAPLTRRLPEEWRDFFASELFERRADPAEEAARISALAARAQEIQQTLAWPRLMPAIPEKRETALRRNQRLLGQYDAPREEYGWEIMRAFARAAHVLLGHVDAYANEGYIRTATQWDNVRRLAATVNYQPAPPASATTDIALFLDPDKGPAEIARGLAMKYAPPEGGAPLVFETLKPVMAHPDLNAARAVGWDRDERPLTLSGPITWIAPDKATLASGDLAILLNIATDSAEAVSLSAVTRDEDAGTAAITFSPTPTGTYPAADAALLVEPAQVLIGQAKSTSGVIAAILDELARFTVGGLARYISSAGNGYARVLSAEGGTLRMAVDPAIAPEGNVRISAMTPLDVQDRGEGPFVESTTSQFAVFDTPSGIVEVVRGSGVDIGPETATPTGQVNYGNHEHGWRMAAPAGATLGYVLNADYLDATIIRQPPTVIIGRPPAPSKTVRFLGKPPKGLEAGDWFAARSGASIFPLRVEGVRTEPDGFYLEFHEEVATPEATEFHGPMKHTLRPLNHDRRHHAAVVADAVVLANISDAARAIIRPRRTIFVEYDRDGTRTIARAEVLEIVPVAGGLRLVLAPTVNMSTWAAGWVRFLINTVQISHGETKGSKTLGSGDAEVRRQLFAFDVKKISFVPSSAAESGVAPDIDVAVNDVVWPYRDMIDPAAEDAQAWSYVLTEDGGLSMRFRRRLTSGFNNVKIARHRIGVGLEGSGVPPFSFTKPMKKHRFVTGIVQPFATEGGSDREPASAMRENAPARLAANGRAVSLLDFESLSRRHSSVWRARATQMIGAGAAPGVRLVIVPAGGGGIAGIEADLAAYIRARALPGVEIAFVAYQDFRVAVSANIQVDFNAFDKNEVQEEAIAALTAGFALEKREIGQPFYIAEIMAALERIEGVSSTTITAFAPAPGAPPTGGIGQARLSLIGGSVAAIFPTGDQVAWLSSVSVTPEAVA